MPDIFSQPVTAFHGFELPEPASPAGYAALIDHYQLPVPLPPRLTAIAVRHHPAPTPSWQLLTPRHAPAPTLGGQLEFALKWEGVDLGVLSTLFNQVTPDEIADIVRATPTGAYSRRLWFLYEWLTARHLDLEDAGKVRTVPAIDLAQQFALDKGKLSPRHRIVDNMPGTPSFCPLVRKTPLLEDFANSGLNLRAREVIGRTHPDVVMRAARFLLLSDSRSSFNIEGERPTAQRATRWGQVIGEAGAIPLTVPELERLQQIVIGDARFVRLGLRDKGGFVGAHDRDTGEPIPEHISARADDLPDLMAGLIAFADRASAHVDPVVAAAAIAFGFVYIHPFEDGNGRLHRWLIHHVLARAGYNPPGLVFPISAAILRYIDRYKDVLESYSGLLLPLIEYRVTPDQNVEVTNQTAPYYRYFDATAHAEFLYGCVAATVERDLPDEVAYLQAYDRFANGVQSVVDMPEKTIDLLNRFLQQGQGRLSGRAREREFNALSDEEVGRIEQIYAGSFTGGR